MPPWWVNCGGVLDGKLIGVGTKHSAVRASLGAIGSAGHMLLPFNAYWRVLYTLWQPIARNPWRKSVFLEVCDFRKGLGENKKVRSHKDSG
jgi:hypothetical protein